MNARDGDRLVPPAVAVQHASWRWSVVSAHPPDSVTWRLADAGDETRFLKITRTGWTPSARAEADRLRWARPHLPVPELLDDGTDADGTTWLLTRGMRGLDATHPSLRADERGVVSALAHGLRELHTVPAGACPFQFRVQDALRVAHERLAAGRIDPQRDFHPEHAHLSAAAAVLELEHMRPAQEDLVVCHGDYCPPNVLLAGGRVTGFVDLGELGVADRWWDLAVATWSVGWNYGRHLEATFLAAYGVEPDAERIRFYRLLYDVVS